MTWLRSLISRWRSRNDTVLSAMSLQVYRRPDGVALVVALCDLLMDTIEEQAPPAPGLQ